VIKKIAKININKEIIDEITEALRDLLKNNLIKMIHPQYSGESVLCNF